MQRLNKGFVMADVQQRVLCFEYVPNGSLLGYITDPSRGLEWRERYQIIKGVCEGLNYLHKNRIFHLDLKPANILMDDNMDPKIADFGLSRCFDEEQSLVMATKVSGTLGYMPPEFSSCTVTRRYDIYSLGVIIIEILTGKKGYHATEDVRTIYSSGMVYDLIIISYAFILHNDIFFLFFESQHSIFAYAHLVLSP
ncbi:G-type lectin S-receptor-like serine/threonine-protein kinase [Dichanthelium oligosanthes]|uniref:non-specific serine/threonine protein kinase n=1 Tax=Dichanthelium oligosanthes TaxID=888268 RepID=A0A1E5VQP2_9POAL|nr:G-type lectin S-receptor-like serine/threonine-protein kinase [Dichanthelium oligosanthes]